MTLLTGRTAFVTGAGGGLGRAIALAFAAEGAAVAVADVDGAAAERVAAEITSQGGQVLPIRVDVAQPESVRTGVSQAAEVLGGIDILVNNAGICPLTRFGDISLEEWNRVLSVNLTGAFLCAQAAEPFLRKSRHGRIINISSLAGRTGGVTVGAHYSASKGGLIALTKVLARVLAADGVTANCIAPGTLDTAMTADWPEANKDLLRRQVPLGRLGLPEEVATAALFLASDGGSYITGATLDVNGGIAMI